MSFLIILVLLLVVMYVLMIRPQRQRQQQQQSMIEGAGVGDDILTTGGIYGTVTEAEGDDVVVEAETLDLDATEDLAEDAETDEAGVTDGEEAVTTGGVVDTAADDRR